MNKNSNLKFYVYFLFALYSHVALAQNFNKIPQPILYKKIDTLNLYMYKYMVDSFDAKKTYDCILLIHGGGWVGGNYKMLAKQASYLSTRGLITFSLQYRVKDRNNSTPFDATADAHDAFEYLVAHAKELNINPKRIIVAGGSAGGHLAITTWFWNPNKIKPYAFILFNPVLDTGPNGFAYKQMEGRHTQISPIDNIGKGHPPTLIMVGTKDKVLPIPTAEKYKALVEQNKGRCDLIIYDDQEHGFFNKSPYFEKTLLDTDKFLQSLGLIKGKATFSE